jgi:hypothetical protein
MKSHDLANALLVHPNMEVILQKDGEGNGYSPCAGADTAIYVADSTYSGEVYDLGASADDNGMDTNKWEAMKLRVPTAMILFPVN